MIGRTAALLLVFAALPGCRRAPERSDMAPQTAAPPVITRISPDSGYAGVAYPVELTIEGRAFADTNIVSFGPVTLTGLPARDAHTRIVLLAPKEHRTSAEVPPMPLPPGEYEVRVTTPAGRSNALTFRLVSGGE